MNTVLYVLAMKNTVLALAFTYTGHYGLAAYALCLVSLAYCLLAFNPYPKGNR